MNCVVCPMAKKYKCSKCRAPYCSSICFQSHQPHCPGHILDKPTVNNIIVEDETIFKTDYLSDEELRIPQEKLLKLKSDERIRAMLRNESFREKLLMIDNCKQRMTTVQ